MHFIERNACQSDLEAMTDRVAYYYSICDEDRELAAAYWKFVERGYRERGWEEPEVRELEAEADSWLADVAKLTEDEPVWQ